MLFFTLGQAIVSLICMMVTEVPILEGKVDLLRDPCPVFVIAFI